MKIWVGAVIGAGALVLGATVATAATSSSADSRVATAKRVAARDVKTAKDDAAARIKADQDSVSAARAEVALEKATADDVLAKARSDAQEIIDKASSDSADQKAQLDQQASSLADRENNVTAAEKRLHAVQFGDGLFEVGQDIQPGKYHTAGATGCYWAEMKSGGDESVASIVANDNVNGPVTLVVSSPYFKSYGCGTWTKVG